MQHHIAGIGQQPPELRVLLTLMWYVVEGNVTNREHEYFTVVKQLSLLPGLTSERLVTEEPVKMLRLVS